MESGPDRGSVCEAIRAAERSQGVDRLREGAWLPAREFLEGFIEMPVFLQRTKGVLHEYTRVCKANSHGEGLR